MTAVQKWYASELVRRGKSDAEIVLAFAARGWIVSKADIIIWRVNKMSVS